MTPIHPIPAGAVVIYTYRSLDGCTYRVKVEGGASWNEEEYPPGGLLRVIYNAAGQVIAGPHLDELVTWQIVPVATAGA